jgi:hypothetical protein
MVLLETRGVNDSGAVCAGLGGSCLERYSPITCAASSSVILVDCSCAQTACSCCARAHAVSTAVAYRAGW